MMSDGGAGGGEAWATAGAETLRGVRLVTPSTSATIVVWPVLFAVTRPVMLSTLATPGAVDLQRTMRLVSTARWRSRTSAMAVTVLPTVVTAGTPSITTNAVVAGCVAGRVAGCVVVFVGG
jgi:hypothetical protein